MQTFSVAGLLSDPPDGLDLELIAGRSGVQRMITSSHVAQLGLATAGFLDYLQRGEAELGYAFSLGGTQRAERCLALAHANLAAIVVCRTWAGAPLDDVAGAAEQSGVPLLQAAATSRGAVALLDRHLDLRLAPTVSLHGVLVDVFGVGVLMTGPSGIGKSELALELVMKGHRMVADDIVECHRMEHGLVYGSANEVIRHHLEVRGLGIINVKDLFGIAAVRGTKKLDVVLELEEYDPRREYDRIGLAEHMHDILGVDLPKMIVPVRPGRNLLAIVEAAARNRLLLAEGVDSARAFQDDLAERIANSTPVGRVGDEVE